MVVREPWVKTDIRTNYRLNGYTLKNSFYVNLKNEHIKRSLNSLCQHKVFQK